MALIDYKKHQNEIKTVAGILFIAGMWYDLKTDFAVHKESHKLLEYRLSSLENSIATKNTYAISPKSPELETERKKIR